MTQRWRERAGLKVVMVEGSEDNRKITTAEDLARGIAMESRTGPGLRRARFRARQHVILGGIAIPHNHALSGHSDADVALHALTDAVLGTIGAGDIGKHFPPSDPQWRGVSSDRFLATRVDLVPRAAAASCMLDLTLVCEAPRIGPHRDAMVGQHRAQSPASSLEGQREGHHHRRAGLHRPPRRHCGPGAVATVETPRR